MKPTIYLILLITIFSCKHKHVSENEIQRTVENTDTVLAPEIEKPLAKTEFQPRYVGDTCIMDSIYSSQFGAMKLFNSGFDENAKDNIFITFYQNNQKQILNLTDVGFFNSNGKLTYFSNNMRVLIDLKIDYHSGIGGSAAYLETWYSEQKIVVDLISKKKIFDCTTVDEDFKEKGIDPNKSKMETTEWITDSTAYRYDFKYQNDTIILKNYKGNTKPDMKMGMYIFDKDKYILRK